MPALEEVGELYDPVAENREYRNKFLRLLVAAAVVLLLPWLPPFRDWLAQSAATLPTYGVSEGGGIEFLVRFLEGAAAIAFGVTPLIQRPFRLRSKAARAHIAKERRARVRHHWFLVALVALLLPILLEASLLAAVESTRTDAVRKAAGPLARALKEATDAGAQPVDLSELVPARLPRLPSLSPPVAGPIVALRPRKSPASPKPRCIGFRTRIVRAQGFRGEQAVWIVFLVKSFEGYTLWSDAIADPLDRGSEIRGMREMQRIEEDDTGAWYQVNSSG